MWIKLKNKETNVEEAMEIVALKKIDNTICAIDSFGKLRTIDSYDEEIVEKVFQWYLSAVTQEQVLVSAPSKEEIEKFKEVLKEAENGTKEEE